MKLRSIAFFITLILAFSTSSLKAKVISVPEKLFEYHIPISRNPSKRHTHAPLISGETFRSYAHKILDETCRHFDTSTVKEADIIFVGMSYIDFFFSEVLPHIDPPIILITSNGGGTIDDRYLQHVENPKLIKWFGRNIIIKHEKIQLIPLGFCWFQDIERRMYLKIHLSRLDEKSYFKNKDYHSYVNFDVNTNPLRKDIFKYWSSQNFTKVDSILDFKTYLENMSKARFVISPFGCNIDCYRTWEALYTGSIPVVESRGIDDVYEDLPVIIVDNLKTVTKQQLDEQFELLKTRVFNLEKLKADYWYNAIQNTRNSWLESKE